VSLTAILVIAAFALGSALAFIRGPIYGLITYVGVFYLHPASAWWGQGALVGVRWSLLAAAVALLATIVHGPKVPLTPVFSSGPFWFLTAFVAWIAVQSMWAVDAAAHADLFSIYWKLLVVLVLITRCIESVADLKMFLWSHVIGCAYFGWTAFRSYTGGRFEGFPGIEEANAAALVLVTGMSVAGSLFLAGRWKEKAGVIAAAPFMVNAFVSTISRSGFLATAVAGAAFNLLAPKRYRGRVLGLSLLALILFALLTNESYWQRIDTIKYRGQEVEGVDTGASRVAILQAQLRMAAAHPLGCGHDCTTYLSYTYIDPQYHARVGGRASHNTFMSILVDHGIVGAAIYVVMVWWAFSRVRLLRRSLVGTDGLLIALVPAIGAVMTAFIVGDMFVSYVRLEVRIWFIAVLMVMGHLARTTVRPN
jgi:hypothetical protein